MDGFSSRDVRDQDRPDAERSRGAGTEEMHGDAANARSDVTSDGEEEIAGLVHAKERVEADDEDAHGR